VGVLGKDHFGVDFVRYDKDIVAAAYFGKAAKGGFFPYDSSGIVWTAEDEDFGTVVDYAFQVFEIHGVLSVLENEGIIDYGASLHLWNYAEGVVNGGLNDDFIAWGGEAVDYEGYALDYSGNIGEPFSADFVFMLVIYPLGDAFVVFIGGKGVSEYFMCASFLYCFYDKIGGAEIHVGYPEGNEFGLAETFLKEVYLDAIGVFAIYDFIKIVMFCFHFAYLFYCI
jgi:hypothetical protein